MGNFSRDTFNKLKHYVGVRLQQGVPLVDADWNEQEDIRKYELQAFLKWFIGNGVPAGNDGFKIKSCVNRIILKAVGSQNGKSSIKLDLQQSTAATDLGFGPENNLAQRAVPLPAQLVSKQLNEKIVFERSRWFVFRVNDLTEGQPAIKIEFQKGEYILSQVVSKINTTTNKLQAAVGQENDFIIKGGDGTPEGAGRCLVEGWDVLNEADLTYSSQRLPDGTPLDELLPPNNDNNDTRADTVYLEVWEREVAYTEDSDMVNPEIGVETCARMKREWLVRVAEGKGKDELLDTLDGHSFYPLAIISRKKDQNRIFDNDIIELRHIQLTMASQYDLGLLRKDDEQITKDAYGTSYTLDHDGSPNLKMSLREILNAIMRGELPWSNEVGLTDSVDHIFRSLSIMG